MTEEERKHLEGMITTADGAALRDVFCAALNGFVANRHFHLVGFQGEPRAAVEFAYDVLKVMVTPIREPTHGK